MIYKNVTDLAEHIHLIMEALYDYDLTDGVFTEYVEIDGLSFELYADYSKCDANYEPYADAPRYQWLATYFLREERLEEVEKVLADFIEDIKEVKKERMAV